MRNYPVVSIKWCDSSQPVSSWQFLTEIDEEKVVWCETVGFLIRDTDHTATVALSLGCVGLIADSEPDQANGVMSIPKVSILSMKYLTEKHNGVV